MLKQLGIAAACGIALYGLARYLNRNFIVMTHVPGTFPEMLVATNEVPEEDAASAGAGLSDTQDTSPAPIGMDQRGADAAIPPNSHGERTDVGSQGTPCP